MSKIETETGLGKTQPIPDLLYNLVSTQKRELETTNFPPALVLPEVVFGWYKRTSRFKELYKSLVRFSLFPHSYKENRNFESGIAGKIFEEVSYFVLAREQLKDGKVVLSPQQTLDFWKRLYPTASIMENTNTESLNKISVPDGIIVGGSEVGRQRIIAICEYSTKNATKGVINKKTGQREIAYKYPSLFQSTNLLFVVPKGKEPNILPGAKIEVRELPFSSTDLRNFIKNMYLYYREDEESATIGEIQTRIWEQNDRGLDYQKKGGLTREYKAYLDKVSQRSKMVDVVLR